MFYLRLSHITVLLISMLKSKNVNLLVKDEIFVNKDNTVDSVDGYSKVGRAKS